MNMATFLVAAAVVLALYAAVSKIRKRKGGCTGCCGSCPGCSYAKK